MASNKRRHANAIPLASFATWMVIGLFVCAAGLGYVFCKNQLHATGRQIKALERELADLRNRNEVAAAHIATLSSTRALQERFDSGFIKLRPINDDQIVTVTTRPAGAVGNDWRPVSNRPTEP